MSFDLAGLAGAVVVALAATGVVLAASGAASHHAHRTLSPTLDIVDALCETAAGD